MVLWQATVTILVALLVHTEGVHSGENCIRTFHELKASLLSREDNIDSIRRALLPANIPCHIQITIYYHYNTTIALACAMSSEYSAACNSQPIDLAKLPYDYRFRWSSTSVHNFIRPRLLEDLSLYTYKAHSTKAHILIDQICSSERSYNVTRDETCRAREDVDVLSPGLEINLLNELTSHIKMLSLHDDIDIDADKTQGYSALHTSCSTEDYVVVEHATKYQTNRKLLTACLILISIFISTATPHLLAYLLEYEPKLRDLRDHSTAEYFIWGTVMVAFFLCLLIIVKDVHTAVARGFNEESEVKDVRINYILGLVFLGICLFLALSSTLSLCCVFRRGIKEEFPVPEPIEWIVTPIKWIVTACRMSLSLCNGCSRKSEFKESSKEMAQFVAIFFLTTCLNLLVSHTIYILLAVIASPIPTITIVILYVTAIYVMICFWAYVLRQFDNITKQQNHMELVRLIISLISSILLGICFLGSVTVFIIFIIEVDIHVEQYSHDSFLGAMVTTIIPSLLLGLPGIALKRMVEMETDTKDSGRSNKENCSSKTPVVFANKGATQGERQHVTAPITRNRNYGTSSN